MFPLNPATIPRHFTALKPQRWQPLLIKIVRQPRLRTGCLLTFSWLLQNNNAAFHEFVNNMIKHPLDIGAILGADLPVVQNDAIILRVPMELRQKFVLILLEHLSLLWFTSDTVHSYHTYLTIGHRWPVSDLLPTTKKMHFESCSLL